MKANKDSTSYNNTFLYPRSGAGSFIQILFDNLDREKVILNCKVVEIDKECKKVKLSNGDAIEYEYLINTSPMNEFLTYFKGHPFREVQETLSYNKVLVFNLGFNKKSKYVKEHWFYIPDKHVNFYRIGFYDNILDADKLSMYVEIGYEKDAVIHVEEQLELTLKNLQRKGIISEDMELEAYSTIIMDPAYVHISKESEEKVKEFMKKEAENNIYSIGRYGGWTYCSMEDCMVSAKELAEKLS